MKKRTGASLGTEETAGRVSACQKHLKENSAKQKAVFIISITNKKQGS